MEEDLRVFQIIDQLHLRAFRNSFPGLPIRSWSQSGSDFELHVPKENEAFYDSEYYYKGELQFFHITPIRNLFSILNERAIRMYDLHSSADPEEYSYAAKILGLSESSIENRKRYYFTFSFCPIVELRNKQIWDSYGDNNEGSAAIVFELLNDPRDWIRYHISEIKYGSPGSFETYRESTREIEIQHSHMGISLHCDLSRLIGFHKAKHWEGEKEVRIASYIPFDDLEEGEKFTKLEWRFSAGRKRYTKYLQLPVWVDNDSSWVRSFVKPEWDRTRPLPKGFYDTRPMIKIKGIHIHPNTKLTGQEYFALQGKLCENFRLNYGYDVEMDINLFRI